MGLRTPLPDTPSLPIGADEVTVLDHTVAYATFPNAGKAVTPHAILEVRTGAGEVVWRFDRDGPKPRQVIDAQVALDMNMMMNKVAEEGTGRRALLDGVRVAGKTGTTNAYRDAWFVGFTGNLVGGVWIGNDDYSSTNRMTGGSLPAMTWRAVMAYAHQGIELKGIPGRAADPDAGADVEGQGRAVAAAAAIPLRPTLLTRRGADALVRIERMMEEARGRCQRPASPVSELRRSRREPASAPRRRLRRPVTELPPALRRTPAGRPGHRDSHRTRPPAVAGADAREPRRRARRLRLGRTGSSGNRDPRFA